MLMMVAYLGCKKSLKVFWSLEFFLRWRDRVCLWALISQRAAATEWKQCVCCLEQWQCVCALKVFRVALEGWLLRVEKLDQITSRTVREQGCFPLLPSPSLSSLISLSPETCPTKHLLMLVVFLSYAWGAYVTSHVWRHAHLWPIDRHC